MILQEQTRTKLLGAFTSDPKVWKADDSNETVILAVKTTAQDADDYTVYTYKRGDTQPVLLGTTVLGKDAGVAPVVYNDGTIALFITEGPVAGSAGSAAELYFVILQNKLTTEAATSGTADAWLRAQFKAFMIGLRDLAARFAV